MFRCKTSSFLLIVLPLLVATTVEGLPVRPPGCAAPLTGCGVQQQEPDADAKSALHFVPEEAQQLFVIRPSQILASRDYRELVRISGDALNPFINRLTNNYFKFGLAKLEDIDVIVFASWPKTDSRHDPGHMALILRTAQGNADGFDMATHAVKEQIEFQGETIFVVKQPLNRQFGFAWIADDQTIVWGSSQESVKAAISTGETGVQSQPWYRIWSPLASDSISFVWVDPAEIFGGLTSQFGALKKIEVMVGGVKPARKTTASWIGVCPDEKAARQIVDLYPELLKTAKRGLKMQMENTPVNQQFLIRMLSDAVDRATMTSKGKLTRVESSITLDLEALAKPLNQLYADSKRFGAANNLRQQALAFHNFHSAMGRFPSPVMVHESGKKYSWRIAILPYIERQDIYERYDFTQDWDSPHNLEVTSEMPDFFRSDYDDESTTNTSFFMLSGPGGLFDGETALDFPQITDGTSNTIMAIEARRDVHWAKPEDIVIHPDEPLPQFGGFHEGGFNVAMADGSIRFVSEDVAGEVLRKLFTAQGGEITQPSDLEPQTDDPDDSNQSR